MKNIIINRQSICMADDVENHIAKIIVSDTCSYLGLIEELKRAKYLPSYDTMWLLCSERSGGRADIFLDCHTHTPSVV